MNFIKPGSAAPLASGRRLAPLLLLFSLLMIALAWAVALERSHADQVDRLAAQQRSSDNLAAEAAAQVQAGLQGVEQLLSIVKSLRQAGESVPEIDAMLQALPIDRRLVDAIGLLDAQGRPLFVTRPGAGVPRAPDDLSGNAVFLRQRGRAAGAPVLMDRPLLGPPGHDARVSLSLRVAGPDGGFGGLVFADLRLGAFAASLAQARLGERDFLALVGEDGIDVGLPADALVGPAEAGLGLPALVRSRGAAPYRGPVGRDRLRRLVNFRRLPGYPLFVAVGVAESDALAGVVRRRRLYFAVAALISALIGAFAVTALVSLVRQDRLRRHVQASESRLRTLLDRAPDAIVSCDDAGRILGWNRAAERMFGYRAADVLAGPITRLLPRRSWQPLFERLRATGPGATEAADSAQVALDLEARAKAGREFPAMVSLAQWQSDQGPVHTAIIRDVSELREAQARTERLSRLYRALSACNQAIVQSADADELFRRVCRAAVEAAGMSMACVMLVGPDGRRVEPAAAWGSGLEFLKDAGVSVSADEPGGRGLIGAALRERVPQWSQDYIHDPRTAPWHARAERFGWAAGAALPLWRDGAVVGTLFLFAAVRDAFDPAVQGLLVEMAADIGHALNGYARQAERQAQDRVLRTLGLAIEHSPVSVLVVGLDGRIAFANPKVEQATGYTRAEIIGSRPSLFKSGQMPEAVYRQLWAALAAGQVWQGELCNRRKDGSLFWEQAAISPIVDEDGSTISYLAVKEDITERRAQQAQIEHLAFFDALTRLPNRSLLADRLAHALASAGRSGRPGALLFIDLDDFKTVNDTLGHELGDQLLVQVARRLVHGLREADTAARLGGDEFVVLLENLDPPLEAAANQVEAIAEKLRAALHQPYELAGRQQRSSASIGIAFFGEQPLTVDELMKRADLAMYQAKGAGRDTLRFYEPAIQERVVARAGLEADLRRGLQEGGFLLHYQPQV
ncbi:MAG: diguanylate cyclase, partial [Burkholderiales bacterium]|nr:diguanylate cyclase [Burkholderiales bacterium]